MKLQAFGTIASLTAVHAGTESPSPSAVWPFCFIKAPEPGVLPGKADVSSVNRDPWHPFQSKFSLAKELFAILKTWKIPISIIPRYWQHADNRCPQELAALRPSWAVCTSNFRRNGTAADSSHDLLQNTRRWLSYSRKDTIWPRNCFHLLRLLWVTTELSKVQVVWLHQVPSSQGDFSCVAMQQALSKGISKQGFCVGVSPDLGTFPAFPSEALFSPVNLWDVGAPSPSQASCSQWHI